jgi:hypothetical protein
VFPPLREKVEECQFRENDKARTVFCCLFQGRSATLDVDFAIRGCVLLHKRDLHRKLPAMDSGCRKPDQNSMARAGSMAETEY